MTDGCIKTELAGYMARVLAVLAIFLGCTASGKPDEAAIRMGLLAGCMQAPSLPEGRHRETILAACAIILGQPLPGEEPEPTPAPTPAPAAAASLPNPNPLPPVAIEGATVPAPRPDDR